MATSILFCTKNVLYRGKVLKLDFEGGVARFSRRRPFRGRTVNKCEKNREKSKEFKTGSRKKKISSDQKSGGVSIVADSAVILVLPKTLIFDSKQLPEIRQKNC